MAKFATDFSGPGAIGALPTGWSNRWNALGGSPKTIFTNQSGPAGASYGGKIVLVDVQSTGGRSIISADALGSAADIDMKARIRATAGPNAFAVGLAARGVEDGGGFDGYFVAIGRVSNTINLSKIVNGTATSLLTPAFTMTSGLWYWMRFQVSGTALRVRMWAHSAAEPGTWLIDTTDSDLSAAGFAGIYNRDCDGEVDWFGAGTGGDTPPDPTAGSIMEFSIS